MARIRPVIQGSVTPLAGDFREVDLPFNTFDVILAAAGLHHLREKNDWKTAFERLYRLIAPSGTVWITDLVSHEIPAADKLMWKRYGTYLQSIGGADYRDKVSTTSTGRTRRDRSHFSSTFCRRSGFHVSRFSIRTRALPSLARRGRVENRWSRQA